MNKTVVAIVKYEKPLESVRKVVDLCNGLARVSELLSSDRTSSGLSIGWHLPCLTLKRDILLAEAKDLHHLILKL